MDRYQACRELMRLTNRKLMEWASIHLLRNNLCLSKKTWTTIFSDKLVGTMPTNTNHGTVKVPLNLKMLTTKVWSTEK
jgi:hypothetical protein